MEGTDYGRQSEGHTAIVSGYLYKIAHNSSIFARWHRRYYVLYSDGLLYSYKSDRSKSSNRTIPVGRMCLRMKFGQDTSYQDCHYWPKALRNLCFSIINSDRSYHFFCDSEKELNSWRQHLLGTLGKLASSSNWILAEKEESETAATEKEGIANHIPHSVVQTEVEVQTVGETSFSKQEQLPYDAVGPATSLVGRKEGEDNWSLDRSSEASKGSISGDSITAHVSSENLISVRSQLEQFEQSSEEEPSDTEEQLPTQGIEDSGAHDHNPASSEGRIFAAPCDPGLHPPVTKSDQQLEVAPQGESEVLLTQFDTESESSDSEDEDDEPTVEYHTNRPLVCSTGVKNTSSDQPPKLPSDQPSKSPSVEGTEEAAMPFKGNPPSILQLREHEQMEVTKAETPQIQPTALTVMVTSEEAIPLIDTENTASESSEAFAATLPTEDQPPPTVREEHTTDTLGTQAVEKPATARPPSPAKEDEDPGPLPVRQRLKRFSEPSKPVAPGNPAFGVMPLARHPQSYPQLPRLEEKGEGEEKREDRVAAAVGWVDKELRKLIAEIQRLGYENEAGQTEVKFGILFEETANTFEALSGILRTAKKHKVVNYSGELLFQGVNDHTPVTLLRTKVEDASLDKYTTANPRGMKRTDLNPDRKKTSGFGNPTQMTANCKCFICGKRVYAMEFVAANEYTFHKFCFRCLQCSKPLSPGSYATINDKFYCIPHYERLYKAQGGYGAL